MSEICEKCGRQYQSRKTLNVHRKKCNGGFKCEFCDQIFRYEHHLDNHKKRKTCHVQDQTMYNCPKCDKAFIKLYNYQRHEKICKYLIPTNETETKDTYGEAVSA